MKQFITLCILWIATSASAQAYVERSIKSFGAKGDGKTDDHAAFEKAAAFFNGRGGQGKLLIQKGTYLVGKQVFNKGEKGKPAYQGSDVLYLVNVQNLVVEGESGALVKFKKGLRFGAFDPASGKPVGQVNHLLRGSEKAAFIGNGIYISGSSQVQIKDLELDGNSSGFELGGADKDGDRQQAHYGIYIQDSKDIQISNVAAHHFGLDGICIANGSIASPDSVQILNSRFEYNARQGLSWIGGNGLVVKNSHFDHTGQGRFVSAPGAGVDIEAEEGEIKNGLFDNCTFTNNKRFGLVAHSGNSSDCRFVNCTFWGLDYWSLWVVRPRFQFIGCRIYGAFVHGYDAAAEADATRFSSCHFEDRSYKGKKGFGEYLVESNNKRRVAFDSCTFISNRQKLIWVEHNDSIPAAGNYRFTACQMIIRNQNLIKGDYAARMKGVYLQNCLFCLPLKRQHLLAITLMAIQTRAILTPAAMSSTMVGRNRGKAVLQVYRHCRLLKRTVLILKPIFTLLI